MLCYIENTRGETKVDENHTFLFEPPQSEQEAIDQIIKITELIKAINATNYPPDEKRVKRWMDPGLSLEEATIRLDIERWSMSLSVKNTAFIANQKRIPDSRFTTYEPAHNSQIGSDIITVCSSMSTIELLEARARSLADRLLEGRVLSGVPRDDNEAVFTLPGDKEGHRVGLMQMDIFLRLMASQLDEVLCEIKDFVYQGTFASRKQRLPMAEQVAKAAKKTGVDGVIRSYDVRSVDIQFPDREASIIFTEALDEVSAGSLKTIALTRCVLRVEKYTAVEIAEILRKKDIA